MEDWNTLTLLSSSHTFQTSNRANTLEDVQSLSLSPNAKRHPAPKDKRDRMFDERSEEFVIPPGGDGEKAFGRGRAVWRHLLARKGGE